MNYALLFNMTLSISATNAPVTTPTTPGDTGGFTTQTTQSTTSKLQKSILIFNLNCNNLIETYIHISA